MSLSSETDQPAAPRLTAAGVPMLGSDKDKPSSYLPLPNDDEAPPGQTIAVLEEARAALFHVLGALFDAAVQIVGSLLSLVQSLAGRNAAETVDKAAAEVLDGVIPNLPVPPDANPPGETTKLPTGETPAGTTPEGAPPVEPEKQPTAPDREAVMAEVRGILTTNATPEEQSKITDQLVDLVTSGVLFMHSLEQQHPGLIERVMARDTSPDVTASSGDGAGTVDREGSASRTAGAPDTPRVAVSVSVD